ncbi:MAG: galactokinase family protein [Bryobacteraceae bacterium]
MTAAPGRGRVAVPGRVNLIGEHVDYHGLAVLPMALARRVEVEWTARDDALVRAESEGFDPREFRLDGPVEPWPSGDWGNYVKAAAAAALGKWRLKRGAELRIRSTLPMAAGLSSSTALMTACTLALLEANGVQAGFGELMEVLPEGEYFVGTRGGAMDHAAVLGAREGCALLVEFEPLRVTPVSVPQGWAFLVADSGVRAEKSAAVRAQYNERRFAGQRAAEWLGFAGIRAALEETGAEQLRQVAERRLEGMERRCLLHVAGEAERVQTAVAAMRSGDAQRFGRAMDESHESLRDLLQVSCEELDRLVEAAREAGALGARLTGAGFGGAAVVFCLEKQVEQVSEGIGKRFYKGAAGERIFRAAPSAGALELIARAGG